VAGEQRKRPGPARGAPVDVLGYTLAWVVETLVFLWVGTKVDGWLGTRPWFTVVLALGGAALGFYSMYRHLMMDTGRQAEAGEEEGRK
jgi:F0F1-type ATP synthase assembly protein I